MTVLRVTDHFLCPTSQFTGGGSGPRVPRIHRPDPNFPTVRREKWSVRRYRGGVVDSSHRRRVVETVLGRQRKSSPTTETQITFFSRIKRCCLLFLL